MAETKQSDISYKGKYRSLFIKVNYKYKNNFEKNTIKHIFQKANSSNYKDYYIREEDINYTSFLSGSNFTLELIKKKFPNTKELILTDCTANIGTESIFLSRYFKKINSIEIIDEIYIGLEKNIKLEGRKNIITFNGDSTMILKDLTQDIVYADFPWNEYKKETHAKLYLSGLELADFYDRFHNHAKFFVFKVPKNYDFSTLDRFKDTTIINRYPKVNKKGKLKYYVITMHNI